MKSTLILCYGYVALHAPEDQLLTRIDSDILQNISKNFNTKVKHNIFVCLSRFINSKTLFIYSFEICLI